MLRVLELAREKSFANFYEETFVLVLIQPILYAKMRMILKLEEVYVL